MNILFITDSNVYPLRGGIDRIVSVLAAEFAQQSDYKCFLAYFDETDNEESAPFEKRIKLNRAEMYVQLSEFIKENNIDRIVVSAASKQNNRLLLPIVHQIAKNIPHHFWFHSTPGYELLQKPHNRFVKWIGSFLLRPKYASFCRYADKIILLSSSYIPLFAKYAGVKNMQQFIAINNSLSFNEFADKKTVLSKGKTVLIVARIDEKSKRISLALKIWKQVENICNDWQLVIVGSGEDEEYCKNLAETLQLKNCSFEGQQPPLEYYRKASVFMMTSSYEGFPMTLTEAQQNGVVPIAFDSFAAVHDIIKSGENGVIVREKDVTTYVSQLIALMKDDSRRQAMAAQAVESSKRFEVKKVMERWEEMLNSHLPYSNTNSNK